MLFWGCVVPRCLRLPGPPQRPRDEGGEQLLAALIPSSPQGVKKVFSLAASAHGGAVGEGVFQSFSPGREHMWAACVPKEGYQITALKTLRGS